MTGELAMTAAGELTSDSEVSVLHDWRTRPYVAYVAYLQHNPLKIDELVVSC